MTEDFGGSDYDCGFETGWQRTMREEKMEDKVIWNQGIKKIDIPGFGSCLVHDYRGPSENAIKDTLQYGDWTLTYSNSTPVTNVGDIYIDTNTLQEYVVDKDLKWQEVKNEEKELKVTGDKVPSILRCNCGAEGQYWGMRLAFPLPLCFTCLKREHKKEALPKVGLWRRVWRFLTRKRT